MNSVYTFLTTYMEPLTSPFYLLFLLLLLSVVFKRMSSVARLMASICVFTVFFWGMYHLAIKNPLAAKWLYRLNSPLWLILAILVLPAIFLPRKRWYKYFLLLPAVFVGLSVLEVINQYTQVPAEAGFVWFPIRPEFLFAGVTGALVILQYLLPLDIFRKVTRITMLLLLIYGGFAFRQSYADYIEMLERRMEPEQDIMLIAETTPVLKEDERLSYLPSAPCRFSADGGYVQGCVMELLQRLMQVNFMKVIHGDPSEVALLAIALAALLSIITLLYIGARWWCGWVCPLSALGDVFDTVRRWLGLPYVKPVQPLKLSYFYSGLSFASFSLLLAKLYPHIDDQGKFLGCKIPVYPFCKICPGQQICPVASQGFAAYPPLPGMEWLFGYFRVTVLLLLVLFLVGFMTVRRLWCYFCPMGMIGGIFNRGGLLALKKDVRKCNGCGVCNEVCPMDIHFVQEEMEKEDVSTFDCVYCLKCVDKCPQDKCLHLEFAGKKIVESAIK
jgi:ferredoxin-type protein NapH